MGNSLSTIGGYATLFVIAGYIYYTNRNGGNRAGRRGLPMKPAARTVEARKEAKDQPKSRKAKKEVGSSGGEETRSVGKTLKKKVEQTAQALPTFDTGAISTKDTDKDGDAEFARQLSSLKKGTTLTSKPQVGPRQKSVKQARAQEKPAAVETSSDNATAPSSAAGGDADDDQSPVSSPDMSATTNGDDPVADMLQPASPGASVLRITESQGPVRPKKETRTTTNEQVETKKQRQNRKKNEAKKLALQEDEKERKVLMEKQRRAAREAEGRAAKDGSSFMAKAPSSSAWTGPSAASSVPTGNGTASLDLLDTYEPSNSKPTPSTATGTNSASQQKTNAPLSDLTSEEQRELDRAIQDSQWEEVKKKTRKAKKPVTESEITEKPEPVETQTNFGIPPVIKPTGPGQKWDMTLVSADDNGTYREVQKEVQDSEWEVA
ncbi:hypothetical protein PVAG01_01527 [Phlyctema vagabunda]|uniref:Uncharacterized protein n=1 Tax=Phlyctema vagabunda TaxID=108571 RepID=A0ABR4PXV9_9HELO